MIGVFDSGLGGLTILKSFRSGLRDYSYMYLGDNKRAPYGSKSFSEIYKNGREGVGFLFDQGCHIVVIACNTVSARALRRIQKDYPNNKVLGMIVPTIEEVVEMSKGRRVGLLATQATVGSGTYEREIRKVSPEVNFYQQAAPKLVELIESGDIYKNNKKKVIING